MNGTEYRRRHYLQTVDYYYCEDDSLLELNFNSSLKLSSHSEEAMDVDCDDYTDTDDDIPTSNEAVSQSVRKYSKVTEYNFHQNNQLPEVKNSECLMQKESPKSCSRYLSGILLALFVIFCYSFVNYHSDVNNTSKLQNIAEELQARVLFQNESVQLILKNFQCVNTTEECRIVLPFVGSTGVGKSFVVNIIKKHFPGKYVNELSLFKLNTVQERGNVIKTIDEHVCNLIIMDDLRFEHVNSVMKFANALPNVRCLFVIPIFNVQETDDNIAHAIHYEDFENIPRKFAESSFRYEAISFNVINKDVVEKWLEKLLINRNVDQNHFITVIRNILEHHDVKHHGFKGIEAKVNLLLHQYSRR